jgi:hypothetical protein
MKKIALLPLFLLCLITGCGDLEEHYSTNANHILAFSADTLAFDTVFTTVGSTTKKIMVYNKNKEALNIQSISLAGKGNSGFRMNVDGKKGSEFWDVLILPKDSMYLFVEVTVDPQDRNNPFEITDSIVFLTNGVTQAVVLQAYGQDAHIIRGGLSIQSDTTWTGERPYLVYDSIVIQPGAKLTIDAGASFYLHDKAKIEVYGTILANGSIDKPILFRGDRLDDMLDGRLAYDNVPGQWGGFKFHPDSYNNLFEHVIVRSGKNGIVCLPATTDQPKLTFNGSQITNMAGNLLVAENCHIEAVNSEFTNAEDSLMALSGGKYSFIHCTITNRMSNVKNRTTAATLLLEHNAPYGNKTAYPIEQARFVNCIIEGSYTNELEIAATEEFDYQFVNCYLKTKEVSDAQYVNCLFSGTIDYLKTGGSEEKYAYDFRLKSDDASPNVVIEKADMETARRYPQDRYGVIRVSETVAPDIGAYQYVPEVEEE